VDGGIIGPANRKPGAARIYLSGPAAAEVAPLFASGPIEAHVLTGPIGAASALKVAFAGWNKASQGLLAAIRAYAIAEGVDAALLAEWKISMPEVPARSERAVQDNVRKAWRFVGEMEEIAQAFAAVGLPSGFTRLPPTSTGVSRATRTPRRLPPSRRRRAGSSSSALARRDRAPPYISETIACCGISGSGCRILRVNPARRSMASSSANVYASPAGVVQSITRLKAAAGAGETRSALGTNSSVTARPPGARARRTLARSRSQAAGSKWWRKIGEERHVVPLPPLHVEGAARDDAVARRHAGRGRIVASHLQHSRPVHRGDLGAGMSAGEGDPEETVPGRDVEHAKGPAGLRGHQIHERLGGSAHHRHHGAREAHPHRMVGGYRAAGRGHRPSMPHRPRDIAKSLLEKGGERELHGAAQVGGRAPVQKRGGVGGQRIALAPP
jgi:hypothetical protein